MAELKYTINELIRLFLLRVGLPTSGTLTASRAITTNSAGALAASTATTTELQGLAGLTASRALATDGSGILSASTVTTTQLQYLAGLSAATNLHIPQFNGTNLVNRAPLGTGTVINLNAGGANDTNPGANVRLYAFTTLPTTATWYQVTQIQWQNGSQVNGTVTGGVEYVDANPPVGAATHIAAYFAGGNTQTGVSTLQAATNITSFMIPGGSIVGVYVATSGATGNFLTATVASQNNTKSVSGSATLTNGTAWAATTESPLINLTVKPCFGV